jgi:MFS family permease
MTTQTEKTSWIPALAATAGMVLVTMDIFMKPVAKKALEQDFGVDAGAIQAAISIFAIIYAGLCILGGKLGDMHGKKKIYIIGLALYGLSALVTTMAPTFSIVVLGFAVIRGLAAPLAIPASVALIIASYTDEAQRGKAFSIYGVGGSLAGLAAPLLMGFMADNVSWRVPFGLEVVIAAVGIFLTLKTKETQTSKSKLDGLGIFLTFVAIAAVILAGMLGSRFGWWDARRPFELGGLSINPLDLAPSALLYGIGILFAVLLLNHILRSEEKGRAALFSLKLFENGAFSVLSVMALLFYLLVGALPFIVPIFLQDAVNFSGSMTGIVMTAFMIGSIASGMSSGVLIQKMQARTLMQIAMVLCVAGMLWLLVASSPTMKVVTVLLPMIVIGLGFGTVTTQIGNIQISTLSPELQGGASGFAEMMKEIGVGLGTAVIGSIMFSLAIGGMVDKVALQVNENLSPEERTELILQVEDNAVPDDVDKIVQEKVPNFEQLNRAAYVDAFKATMGVLMVLILGALLAVSFLPKMEVQAGAGH